jgi:hypothetical protein
MRGAIPPLPQHVFMVWCLVKHRDNFTFTLRGQEDFLETLKSILGALSRAVEAKGTSSFWYDMNFVILLSLFNRMP